MSASTNATPGLPERLRQAAVAFAAGKRDPDVGMLLEAAEALETRSATLTGSEGEALAAEVNAVWKDVYSCEDNADTPTAIKNRVRLLGEDVKCGRANFAATNKAYIEADRKLREMQSATLPLNVKATLAAARAYVQEYEPDDTAEPMDAALALQGKAILLHDIDKLLDATDSGGKNG